MIEDERLKLAFFWGGSCGGCEIAILDTDTGILEIGDFADIVLWPIAIDAKYADVEALPHKSIDVCLYNGSCRNSELVKMAKLLRVKSKIMIAFGTCACHGGVPALANFANREEVFDRVYISSCSTHNPDRIVPQAVVKVPEGEVTLPEFYNQVLPLDQVVNVDYYIPGCPPHPELIMIAIGAIKSGNLPPKGSMIYNSSTVCKECPREQNENKKIRDFQRIYEVTHIDQNRCFLEQGLLCCGPATAAICQAACIKANMPCRGCSGPPPEIRDQGAKMISVLGSIVDTKDPEEFEKIISQIPDLGGIFYQFSLGSAILNHKRTK